MESFELRSKGSGTSKQATTESPEEPSSVREKDDARLRRIGKKPVLKVRNDTLFTGRNGLRNLYFVLWENATEVIGGLKLWE